MKKTLFMVMSLMLLFVATASGQSSAKKAGISIDSRIKYQHVTGFGGFSPSPQWSYWLGDAEMNKLFGKGDTQLGLNILRLYIANSKNVSTQMARWLFKPRESCLVRIIFLLS